MLQTLDGAWVRYRRPSHFGVAVPLREGRHHVSGSIVAEFSIGAPKLILPNATYMPHYSGAKVGVTIRVVKTQLAPRAFQIVPGITHDPGDLVYC
jgi:hypothetical protein